MVEKVIVYTVRIHRFLENTVKPQLTKPSTKCIYRILDECLLISSLLGKATRTHVELQACRAIRHAFS